MRTPASNDARAKGLHPPVLTRPPFNATDEELEAWADAFLDAFLPDAGEDETPDA